MIKPNYTLEEIKYCIDIPSYEKACNLYENNKVKNFKEEHYGTYTAKVEGTKTYDVSVDCMHYDVGSCNCYIGQQNILCKHMIAVAIYAIFRGKPLTDEDKNIITKPICSNIVKASTEEEIGSYKLAISIALKYIKAYTGNSKKWFIYQDSLTEGVRRLSVILSQFPINSETTKLVINLLLKLDKKLQIGGVDDSDGTIGALIMNTVDLLKEFAKSDKTIIKEFKRFVNIQTCFGWEEELVNMHSCY